VISDVPECYSSSITTGIQSSIKGYMPVHMINQKYYSLERQLEKIPDGGIIDLKGFNNFLSSTPTAQLQSSFKDSADIGQLNKILTNFVKNEDYCYSNKQVYDICYKLAQEHELLISNGDNFIIKAKRIGTSDQLKLSVFSADSLLSKAYSYSISKDFINNSCLKVQIRNEELIDSFFSIIDTIKMQILIKENNIRELSDSILELKLDRSSIADQFHFINKKPIYYNQLALSSESFRNMQVDLEFTRNQYNTNFFTYINIKKELEKQCDELKLVNYNINCKENKSITDVLKTSMFYALLSLTSFFAIFFSISIFWFINSNN
jgi:hypothetical protein